MKKNIASQLGFWASVLLAVLGGVYILALIYDISIDGIAALISPSPFLQLVSGIGTLLTALLLVILYCLPLQ
jgi:hypothetical protein